MPRPVIGIDLGTRYVCAGVWKNKRFEIVCDQFGNRTIPSVVSFHRSVRLVGNNALSIRRTNPLNTIYDVKRIIGRRADDPVIKNVQQIVSYEITDDGSEYRNVMIQLDKYDPYLTHKRIYRPEEITAMILFEIKKMATKCLHQEVEDAVITVPAYFNDAQRQATLDSAKIAGLNVIKIINESTAAALAYGLVTKKWGAITADSDDDSPGKSIGSTKSAGGNVIVYDLGAGTLDLTLINIRNGTFRVLATSGNTHLGGEDIDYLLMSHIIREFRKKHLINKLELTVDAQIRLKNGVENAKKLLSSVEKTTICVDDFYEGKKLFYILTRDILELICNDFFIMCMRPLTDLLENGDLCKNDIDDIVMVGGSSRIPKIQALILDFFKDTKINRLNTNLNPDEIVAAGAAIYGYVITNDDDAYSNNLILLDITPLSLGVETLRKQMTIMIPRNTVIPYTVTKVFSTDSDNQDTVTVKIFEGERKLTRDNFHVGTFDLSGFEIGPRGFPIINITFHIDINGILSVTAHEKHSDIKNGIEITSTWSAKGRLSKQELDDIISEASQNESVDSAFSEKIDLAHQIKTICETVISNLDTNAYAIPKVDKKRIRADILANRKWLDENQIEDVSILELEERQKRLSKLYAPLILQIDKANDKFASSKTQCSFAEVHADDAESEESSSYFERFVPETVDYEREEIKAIKKSILDLGANITSLANNPHSNLLEDDINFINDYIETVNIWIFSNSATTCIEYIAKINEINEFTQDIMKKYEDKSVFSKNNSISCQDELYMTCLALDAGLKSNYFSLRKTDVDHLVKYISDTMLWLVANSNTSDEEYQKRLGELNAISDKIYNSTSRFATVPETIEEESSDSEEEIEPQPHPNKIREDTKSLIDSMPDLPEHLIQKEEEVLLKIDMNKINRHKYHYRKSSNKSDSSDS